MTSKPIPYFLSQWWLLKVASSLYWPILFIVTLSERPQVTARSLAQPNKSEITSYELLLGGGNSRINSFQVNTAKEKKKKQINLLLIVRKFLLQEASHFGVIQADGNSYLVTQKGKSFPGDSKGTSIQWPDWLGAGRMCSLQTMTKQPSLHSSYWSFLFPAGGKWASHRRGCHILFPWLAALKRRFFLKIQKEKWLLIALSMNITYKKGREKKREIYVLMPDSLFR